MSKLIIYRHRVNLKPTRSLKPQIMKYDHINSKSKYVYPNVYFLYYVTTCPHSHIVSKSNGNRLANHVSSLIPHVATNIFIKLLQDFFLIPSFFISRIFSLIGCNSSIVTVSSFATRSSDSKTSGDDAK